MPSAVSSGSPATRLPARDYAENRVRQASIAKKDLKFWLIIGSSCLCLFLSALEFASVVAVLPTIANDLHATQFAWAGSAFSLASTAFLPVSGGLAQIFGRRPALLLTIAIFALGSGICGGANSMSMLIAGRTLQGLGSGGIQTLVFIVLADIVTLQERGVYAGLFGMVWALAIAIGPIVGGSLASGGGGRWRWLFYLNLPICFIAAAFVLFFLRLPTPPGSYREKFMRMDWLGIFLVISSTVAYTIGLTWGGVIAPWQSASVLVSLIVGLVGLVGFLAYEATLARHPLVPFSLMTNLTSVSGYLQTYFISLVSFAIAYYFVVYYQACKGFSPLKAGVYTLALVSLAPASIFAGVSVKAANRYRPQMWVSWVMVVIALGVMSTIRDTDPIGKPLGLIALFGTGTGALLGTTMYPIQAPLPVTQNAPALAFMWFLRSFAGVFGISIGSTVLQNELGKKLPASFIKSFPEGASIMYAFIPKINTLPLDTRVEVQAAFAGSLAVLWKVMAIIAAAGLLSSLLMRGVPLHNNLDDDWTLRHRELGGNETSLTALVSHDRME